MPSLSPSPSPLESVAFSSSTGEPPPSESMGSIGEMVSLFFAVSDPVELPESLHAAKMKMAANNIGAFRSVNAKSLCNCDKNAKHI